MKFVKYVEFNREGKLSKSSRQKLWQKVYEKYGNNCYLCGRILDAQNRTVDHIHPLTMWGTNNIENLRPCCYTCNQQKGKKNLYDFCEKYVRDQAIQTFHKRVRIPENILE